MSRADNKIYFPKTDHLNQSSANRIAERAENMLGRIATKPSLGAVMNRMVKEYGRVPAFMMMIPMSFSGLLGGGADGDNGANGGDSDQVSMSDVVHFVNTADTLGVSEQGLDMTRFCATEQAVGSILNLWEVGNKLVPGWETPKPELVAAAKLVGVKSYDIRRVAEEGSSYLAQRALKEMQVQGASPQAMCLKALTVANHYYQNPKDGTWVHYAWPEGPNGKMVTSVLTKDQVGSQINLVFQAKTFFAETIRAVAPGGGWFAVRAAGTVPSATPTLPATSEITATPAVPEAPVILEGDIADFMTKCGSECASVDKNDIDGFDFGTEKALFYKDADDAVYGWMLSGGEWQEMIGGFSEPEQAVVWNLPSGDPTPLPPGLPHVPSDRVLTFKEVEGQTNKLQMFFKSPGSSILQIFEITLDEKSPLIGIAKAQFAPEKISAPLPEGPISELQKTLGEKYKLIQDGDHFVIQGIDNLKIFEGGWAEFTIGGEVLTVSNLAVSNNDGALTAGGWENKDGAWSIFGSGAPSPDSTPEQLAEWEAGLANFVMDEGASPEVQQAMEKTLRDYVRLVTEKTAASEFEDIYVDGEKVDVEIPAYWQSWPSNYDGREFIFIDSDGYNQLVALKGGYANLTVYDVLGKQKLDLRIIPMVIRDTDGSFFSTVGMADTDSFSRMLEQTLLTKEKRTGVSAVLNSTVANKYDERLFASISLQEFIVVSNQELLAKDVIKHDMDKLPQDDLRKMGFWAFIW